MKNLVILMLTFLTVQAAHSQQATTFIAHRGASFLAPENTLASIKLAWELDARAAECDIMLTKDKQVIVFHDKKGKRLTGHNFEVKASNYVDIKSYPIILKESNLEKYSGQTIPLLSDVLETLPDGHTLVIEIKTGTEILPYMKEVISEYWKSGDIAFIAFDFETILATKDLYPDIPCYYLSAFAFDVRLKLQEILDSNLDGINLRHKIITKNLVKKCNEAGKGVWCWTVNEPKDAKKMIHLGVSGITTDRPNWLPENL